MRGTISSINNTKPAANHANHRKFSNTTAAEQALFIVREMTIKGPRPTLAPSGSFYPSKPSHIRSREQFGRPSSNYSHFTPHSFELIRSISPQHQSTWANYFPVDSLRAVASSQAPAWSCKNYIQPADPRHLRRLAPSAKHEWTYSVQRSRTPSSLSSSIDP